MSEHVLAQPQKANAPQETTKITGSLQRRNMNQPEPTTLQERFFDTVSGTFAEPRVGFDFSRVPVFTGMKRETQPLLRTQPMVQRFPKDGAGGSSPCPTCPEAETSEISEPAEPAGETIPPTETTEPIPEPPSPEVEATPTTAEQETESAASGETPASALIVEDSAADLAPGQMKKSEFLSQLRVEVCRTVEAAIAGTGRTTDDCPYLDYWFDFYSKKDSAHIERVIHRYASEASSVTTASGYISVITRRARQSAETWARTGEITGVPEGIPTNLPGQANARGGEGGETSARPIMFKAREGGARAADDPQSIQKELGEGRPLDSGVRSRMESAFGMDFAHVRAHTDTTAAGLSTRMNARAFTVGEHVAFGANEYKPGTLVGDAIIAHELAHVVQQSGGAESAAQMKGGDTSYNNLEDDADKSAVGALTSIWGKTKGIIFNSAQNVMPSLRSGLQLQRCESCDEGCASREEAESTTDPNIDNWSTRTGDGDSTNSDNCCKICSVVTLGIDCNPPHFCNGIELKATIANHSSGYSYNIKRTREGKFWERNGENDPWDKIDKYSDPAGTPDDTLTDDDECLTPIASDSNHHIYSIDTPGFKSAEASGSYTDKVYKKNFTEFVRITRADRTTYDDSNTQDWHNIVWVTKSEGTWSLDRSRSEIDTGHLTSFDP